MRRGFEWIFSTSITSNNNSMLNAFHSFFIACDVIWWIFANLLKAFISLLWNFIAFSLFLQLLFILLHINVIIVLHHHHHDCLYLHNVYTQCMCRNNMQSTNYKRIFIWCWLERKDTKECSKCVWQLKFLVFFLHLVLLLDAKWGN